MRTPYKVEYKDNLRKCAKCNEFKSFDSFGNVKSTHDGKRTRCKLCIKLDRKKYRSTINTKKANKIK